MNEKQLQHKIVVAFSQKYPKKAGQLIHLPNERNHSLQAFQAKALGIYPGVADMIFFSKKFNVATELKAPGYRHKISQIKKQIAWGRIWEKQGNTWRLCMTVKDAMGCYKGKFKGMTLDEVEQIIEKVLKEKPNLQTIKL